MPYTWIDNGPRWTWLNDGLGIAACVIERPRCLRLGRGRRPREIVPQAFLGAEPQLLVAVHQARGRRIRDHLPARRIASLLLPAQAIQRHRALGPAQHADTDGLERRSVPQSLRDGVG